MYSISYYSDNKPMLACLSHTTTPISPDCIKTCPWEPSTVAIAYYQTSPNTQGAIAVASITQDKDIFEIQTVEAPPLLHLAWGKIPNNPNQSLLAAAVRTNDVLIYNYKHSSKTLTLATTVAVAANAFCLYLDLLSYEDHYHLLVSSNEQAVFSIILDLSLTVVKRDTFTKHEYAVWTCRLDPFHKDVFVSGDQVNSIYLYAHHTLIDKNKGSHTAGICDLTFASAEHLLFSGGFDGVVCTYDTRHFKHHINRHDWGGTIWRVVPSPKKEGVLLCNSSQNKFQIVEESLGKQLWNSGQGHGSLAYAGDWLPTGLLTASFYDKKTCFWGYSGSK